MGNASVRARCLACIYMWNDMASSKPDHLWICTDVKNNALFEYQL